MPLWRAASRSRRFTTACASPRSRSMLLLARAAVARYSGSQ